MTELANYKEDSRGRLIPVASIKPVDIARDELVEGLVAKAKAVRDILRDFRISTHADIEAFVDLSAEKYGARIGGKKGNISLVSFNGQYKVQRSISDVIVFDERLQAAKDLIDECITEWAKGSGKEIRTLVTDAFQVDKEGNLNTGRILSLRRLDFGDHPKWKSAMTAISDSVGVAISRSYIRVYERDEAGNYFPINLDLANA